ncbi:MAG: ion transporter [Deltaproteobacteria bacterium]|nr:ion transporter [Deltaproteobacteria bacterium]
MAKPGKKKPTGSKALAPAPVPPKRKGLPGMAAMPSLPAFSTSPIPLNVPRLLKGLSHPEMLQEEISSMRRWVYIQLEPGERGHGYTTWVDVLLLLLIVANGVVAILETIEGYWHGYHTWLHYFDLISVIVFSVEYGMRMWCAVEKGYGPFGGRIAYALTPMALIDLISVLPFYLGLFGIQSLLGIDLRMARLARIFRFMRLAKIGRYSKALRTLGRGISSHKEELMLTFMLGVIALTLSGTLMYYAERHAQPDKFGSIPMSFWYVVTTLTTVGYGDVVPITTFGRFVGGFTQVAGVILFALPAGLLGSSFMDEINRERAHQAKLRRKHEHRTHCRACGRPYDLDEHGHPIQHHIQD